MLASIVVTGEMSLGELLVAAGTLALAGFTWWLAQKTSQEVAKTEEGLQLTRESIEAQDMPFVIGSPDPSVSPSIRIRAFPDGLGFLSIRLWNLGKGPAMVSELSLRTGDGDLLNPLEVQIPVATGEVRDLTHPIAGSVDDLPERWSGELLILYSHASGARYVTVSKVDVDARALTCRSYSRRPSGEVEGAWKRSEARPPTYADDPDKVAERQTPRQRGNAPGPDTEE